MFGAGSAIMLLDFAALMFWYIPSYDEISKLKQQERELKEGIAEL